MPKPQPILNGSTLPRANSLVRVPEPVVVDVDSLGGRRTRYDRGRRWRHELSWSAMTEADAGVVIFWGSHRGALAYVDPIDSVERFVFTDGAPSSEPIAGTDPVRYAVSLSLIEINPR